MSDFQFAVAEKAVNDIVKAIKEKDVELPVFSAPSTNLGSGLSYSCDFGLKLTDGSVDFRSGGSNGNVLLKEIDITWDPLILNFNLNIPTIEIGCECFTINIGPFNKTICLPCIRLFESDADINISTDLSHIFTHEFSGEFSMRIENWQLNERTSLDLSDFEATLTADNTTEVRDDIRDRFIDRLPSFVPASWIEILAQAIVNELKLKNNLADKTNFYFEGDKWLDIDVLDISDTVANILKKIRDAIVNEFLSFIPSWAREIISDTISFIIDGIEAALDFPDDLEEFVNDFFNLSFGVLDFTIEFLLGFVTQVPLFQIEKPYKIINPENDKLPLLIPYKNLRAAFTNDELVIEADTTIL